MDVAAPRDVLGAVKRAERELAACGLGGFLDRLFELGGANVSMDVAHAYNASQEFCSGTSEIQKEMRTRALAAAKRARILIDFIALHARACSAPIFKLSREDDASAVELLREMMSESYRVISSGLCYEDTTRLTSSIQGVIDMIEQGGPLGKILPVVPQIILPIKAALNTRDPVTICSVLKIIQALLQAGEMIGVALVPYYRQLLPVFNLVKAQEANIGDAIDYNQRRRLCLGELTLQTLEMLERTGGPDAFINIKYMIPTYESCCL